MTTQKTEAAKQGAATSAAVPATSPGNMSTRFSAMVMREYGTQIGRVELSPFQQRLIQHLFIKADMALNELEAKRLQSGKTTPPIVWANINLQKMAVDAVHRVELGLDALIPNHLHVIPYLNGKTQKYDVDLRPGYSGKDYYYREMALFPPDDIIYKLIYEKDKLEVIMKDAHNDVEGFLLKVENPFDRGDVVGGIGYIMYPNPKMNKVALVTMKMLKRSQDASGSDKFWGKDKESMQYKTIVHRTVSHIVLDPKKINASFAAVERDEYEMLEMAAQADVDENANRQIIDIEPQHAAKKESGHKAAKAQEQPEPDPPEMTEAEKQAAVEEEQQRMKESDPDAWDA